MLDFRNLCEFLTRFTSPAHSLWFSEIHVNLPAQDSSVFSGLHTVAKLTLAVFLPTGHVLTATLKPV